MAAITICNLSEEAHCALKVRAAQNNRSVEAEMRAIVEAAVRPEGQLRLGTALSELILPHPDADPTILDWPGGRSLAARITSTQRSSPSTRIALPPASCASVLSSMPLTPAMCPIGLYSAMSKG